jgi:MtN3 and saliva related transmembrane protein
VVTLIGSIAALLTTACWLPQVIKTLRLGTADDFAWSYLSMLLVGVAAWAAYGFGRHDPPIYLCNIITGLLVLMVAGMKLHSERARVTRADEVAALALLAPDHSSDEPGVVH